MSPTRSSCGRRCSRMKALILDQGNGSHLVTVANGPAVKAPTVDVSRYGSFLRSSTFRQVFVQGVTSAPAVQGLQARVLWRAHRELVRSECRGCVVHARCCSLCLAPVEPVGCGLLAGPGCVLGSVVPARCCSLCLAPVVPARCCSLCFAPVEPVGCGLLAGPGCVLGSVLPARCCGLCLAPVELVVGDLHTQPVQCLRAVYVHYSMCTMCTMCTTAGHKQSS